MTRGQRKKLIRLIEKETRCTIMARLGRIGWPDSGDYTLKAIKYQDRIRQLVFGTSNLVDLGHKFNLPIDPPRREKKHKNKSLFE